MDEIYQIIKINLEVIVSLNEDTYPELTRLRRKTSVIRHLSALMEHMLTYSMPLWPARNRRYFLFSEMHLATWHKANGGTGDLSTWQSHKVFLLHAGLIKTFNVTAESSDYVLQRIWNAAKKAGRHSETLWTVPLFTPQVLLQAERIAKEYRENHVNLTHIRKNVIARVWGQQVADSLYRTTGHVISQNERDVAKCMKEAIRIMVARKGFTTVDELRTQTLKLCIRWLGRDQLELYESIIRKLLQQKRQFIHMAGYEYHAIRKENRILNIPREYTGYIITKRKADDINDINGNQPCNRRQDGKAIDIV